MPTETDMPDRLVLWLENAEPDPARVGGKGASLIRLARLGFRIPPGFCLTTGAFETQLATLPGAVSLGDDPAALLDGPTRDALGESMTAGPLTDSVRDALGVSLDRLAAKAALEPALEPLFAVRSSSVAEDGTSASFAGLHDTELGVAADGVAAAVLRCWASLWSDRAIDYRRRRDLAPDRGSMAVVVQALVRADAAAVVFTRHPVSGRSDVLLINAVRGLGEAMVSGSVTPHSVLIDKPTGSILELAAGDQAAGAPLELAVVANLAALCLAVEAAFGAPLDIEAAHAAGCWYLLQARPITASGAPA